MNDGVAKNSFTRGCGNLRKSALSEHAETSDHKRALQTPVQIASEKFISLAHILMDIIPIVTALNQFFQKKDIDLALIKVKVNQCISDLETMKTEQTGEDLTNWGTSDLEKLLDHFGEERKVTWTDSEGVEQAKKRIFNIRWPEKIRNEELWERAGQEPAAKQILRRKWGWIGHTLRKPASSTTRQALT
nr:hypothetical protein BaRGS_010639 [Batillaria attramentaria]